MKKSLTLFQRAAERHRKAEQDLHDAMVKQYPIGSSICWAHGHYDRWGMVVDHNPHHAELWVVSEHGKRYRIDAHRINRVLIS